MQIYVMKYVSTPLEVFYVSVMDSLDGPLTNISVLVSICENSSVEAYNASNTDCFCCFIISSFLVLIDTLGIL